MLHIFPEKPSKQLLFTSTCEPHMRALSSLLQVLESGKNGRSCYRELPFFAGLNYELLKTRPKSGQTRSRHHGHP